MPRKGHFLLRANIYFTTGITGYWDFLLSLNLRHSEKMRHSICFNGPWAGTLPMMTLAFILFSILAPRLLSTSIVLHSQIRIQKTSFKLSDVIQRKKRWYGRDKLSGNEKSTEIYSLVFRSSSMSTSCTIMFLGTMNGLLTFWSLIFYTKPTLKRVKGQTTQHNFFDASRCCWLYFG